ARARRRDLLDAADAAVHATVQLAARHVALRRRVPLAGPLRIAGGRADGPHARPELPRGPPRRPRSPEHRPEAGVDAADAGARPRLRRPLARPSPPRPPTPRPPREGAPG